MTKPSVNKKEMSNPDRVDRLTGLENRVQELELKGQPKVSREWVRAKCVIKTPTGSLPNKHYLEEWLCEVLREAGVEVEEEP